ncbi:MAG: hypothetical protein Q7J57_10350, partial [Gemmobacter sp.]|nr:hypothetical protein [Gemmobacter sp.]
MDTNIVPPAFQDILGRMIDFIGMGGAAMWAIAALSVLTVALILWKVVRLMSFGAWTGGARTSAAVQLWSEGKTAEAMGVLAGRGSIRARLAHAAMRAALDPALDRDAAEAETARVARALLAKARRGLRG